MKFLTVLTISSALLVGCGGDDFELTESFTIVNNSATTVEVSYTLNASELKTSHPANYDSEGQFVGGKTYTLDVAPSETATLYSLEMNQHAHWHATGPATPEAMFSDFTVTYQADGVSHTLASPLHFDFYNHSSTDIPPEFQSTYEYRATLSDENIH